MVKEYWIDWEILKLKQENALLELSLSPEELKKIKKRKSKNGKKK